MLKLIIFQTEWYALKTEVNDALQVESSQRLLLNNQVATFSKNF